MAEPFGSTQGTPQVLPRVAGQRGEWLRLARRLNPLRTLWWLFGSARWAIALIALIALAAVLGVLIPQVPANIRGSGVAEAQWLQSQEGKFGPATDWMQRLGLFDIFHARWFVVSLALLVASSVVYTITRLRAVWWSVVRPRKRVPGRYFEIAPQRLAFQTAAGAGALEEVLRRHRYKVERFVEEEATYLFADRYPWAQFGTILAHAAVVVFILAAVVSRATGFSVPLFIAEGGTAPVFALTHPKQMQVRVLDAIGKFNEEGQPLDYRSELAIYQGGEEARRCSATVNSPCEYGGYRFHQAAYFGFGAEVQVRDLVSGNVIYHETLALEERRPSPHVIVREAASGRVLFDEAPLLGEPVRTPTTEGQVEAALGRVSVSGQSFVVGLRRLSEERDWHLLVLEASGGSGAPLRLKAGAKAKAGGLEFEFAGLTMVPSGVVTDLPLPGGAQPQTEAGRIVLQMGNVVYGTDTASEGEAVQVPPRRGPPVLSILGVGSEALLLRPGEGARVGEYEYSFLGQREFAGIQVKRDRSDYLIWFGTGGLLVGLLLTFWVPRRRLWAKITPTRAFLAGQNGHLTDYKREMQELARQAGAELEEEQAEDV